MTASALAKKVLALPHDDRESLLCELLRSLGGDGDDVMGREYEGAWAAEIERRLADLDGGRIETIPADRVMADLRAGARPARG